MSSLRYLGIDYGRARVGIAVNSGTLAEPLEVVSPDQALLRLQQLIAEYHITHLVVGVSERDMASESQVFGRQLESTLQVPVIFWDETLSSVEVQQKLRISRQGKQQYRGPIDHFAAAIILERYLDDHPEGVL